MYFGTLTAFATWDMGPFGRAEGAPLEIHINPFWQLLRLLPALLLLIVLLRARTTWPAAWCILIPLLALNATFDLFADFLANAYALSLGGELARCFTIGLAILWGHFGARNTPVCRLDLLLTIVFLALLMVFGTTYASGFDFDGDTLPTLLICAGPWLLGFIGTMALATAISRRHGARWYHFLVRYTFLLLIGTLLLWAGTMTLIIAISFPMHFQDLIAQVLSTGFTTAGITLALTLPFLVFAFSLPSHRTRFRTILRLPPPDAPLPDYPRPAHQRFGAFP